MQVEGEILRLNLRTASKTVGIEARRGERNSRCKGEICRYREEHQWRKRLSGLVLTLSCES